MNHRKYLRRALTLTALSIPFIMFAFAYMAFAIPADGLQTVLESLIAFTTLTVGVALFAAGWLVWLCALAGAALRHLGGKARTRLLPLLHKIQWKRHTPSPKAKDEQHGKTSESPTESEMEQR